MKLDRIHCFNILRLVACGLVYYAHDLFSSRWTAWLNDHVHVGYLGVDIFFVLSGFLITRIILSAKQNHVPLRLFLIRRALRIFPPYYLLLGLMCIALPYLHDHRPETWTDGVHWSFWTYTFNYALLTQGWGINGAKLEHLWSLCVEEHFYLIWPAIVYLVSRETSRRLIIYAVAPIVIGSFFYYKARHNEIAAPVATNVQMLALSIGALMAYHEAFCRSRSASRLAIPLFLTGLLQFLRQKSLFLALISTAGIAIAIVLIFLCVVEPLVKQRMQFIAGRWMEHLGTMTYGLYLYHLPFFYWFQVKSSWMTSSEALVAIVATTLLSYTLLERRLINLGRFFRMEPRLVQNLSSQLPAP